MQLVRTFHPVGHGAFYTEQFYDGPSCVFTAVYDCGGNPKGGINKYLDNNFTGQHIDVLFISHLHNDHISGVKHLLKINKCERVILPALTAKQKVAAYVQNIISNNGNIENQSNKIIESIYNDRLGVHIVEVELSDGEKRISDSPEGETVPINTSNPRIAAGSKLSNTFIPDWIYAPYNAKYNIRAAFLKKFKKARIDRTGYVDFEKVKNICMEINNWDDVKDLYKEQIKKSANEYSMTVYSGFNDTNNEADYCICSYMMKPYRWCRCRCSDKPNCLYMGDFVARKKSVTNLKKHYHRYFVESKLLQVPHHGSARVGKGNAYGYQLFDHCYCAVLSLKFGQYSGIPSTDLIGELLKRGVSPHVVMEHPYSKFVVEYDL